MVANITVKNSLFQCLITYKICIETALVNSIWGYEKIWPAIEHRFIFPGNNQEKHLSNYMIYLKLVLYEIVCRTI